MENIEDDYVNPEEIEKRFEELKEVVIMTISTYNDTIFQITEKKEHTDIEKEIIKNYEDIYRNIYISKALYDLPPDHRIGKKLFEIAVENGIKCQKIRSLLSPE